MTQIQRSTETPQRSVQTTNVVDLVDRILDKGLVIVGDIRINLLDIELLTVKIRLLVASVDKAKEMGIDWWERDAFLSSSATKNGKAINSSTEKKAISSGEQ